MIIMIGIITGYQLGGQLGFFSGEVPTRDVLTARVDTRRLAKNESGTNSVKKQLRLFICFYIY